MSIFKEYRYGCFCDKCNKHFVSSTYELSMFVDEEWARYRLEDDGWHEIDGKWYCPDCCHYDEEKEEWMVNEDC